MYAPLIGTMGLDLCRRFSREELALMKSVLLNSPLPFHLELCGYVNQAASSLFLLTDDNILLECNEQTGFTVTGNVASLSYTYNFFLPIVVKCYCSWCTRVRPVFLSHHHLQPSFVLHLPTPVPLNMTGLVKLTQQGCPVL